MAAAWPRVRRLYYIEEGGELTVGSSSPMETAFDHTKDPTPTNAVIKATGDLAKDIIKLVKK